MRNFVVIVAFGVALGGLFATGCGTLPCNSNTCQGCCSSSGVCQRGVDNNACGAGGMNCDVCSNIQTCTLAGKCGPAGSGGGGGSGGSGGAGGGSASFKRVFITSASYSGNLAAAGGKTNGLDGADALCNTAATAAALGGTWKAWVSDGTVRAIDRITSAGPWKKLDSGKTTVFNNAANLATLPLTTIDYTENGVVVENGTSTAEVWTGTDNGGGGNSTHCSGWTAGTTFTYGRIGSTNTTSNWTSVTNQACDNPAHLYCFEL